MAGQIAFAESFPNWPLTGEMDDLVVLGTECFHGVNERCWATQKQAVPLDYQVEPPFGRPYDRTGWPLTIDALDQMAITLKQLVPWYVDPASVSDGTTDFNMLTISNVWTDMGIGNGIDQFTATPGWTDTNGTAWPATYRDRPEWIYIVNPLERYKASLKLQKTKGDVHTLKLWMEYRSGTGKGLTPDEAYITATYSNSTTITVSGSLNPDATGIYRLTGGTFSRDDGAFLHFTWLGEPGWQLVYRPLNGGAGPNSVWQHVYDWNLVGSYSEGPVGKYQPVGNATGEAVIVYTPVPKEQYCRTMYWSNFVYQDGARSGLEELYLEVSLANNVLAGEYVTNALASSVEQHEPGVGWQNLTPAALSSNDGLSVDTAFSNINVSITDYSGDLSPDCTGLYQWQPPDGGVFLEGYWANPPYMLLRPSGGSDFRLLGPLLNESGETYWAEWMKANRCSPLGFYVPVANAMGIAQALEWEGSLTTSAWLEVGFNLRIPESVIYPTVIDGITVELKTSHAGEVPVAGDIYLFNPTSGNSITNTFDFANKVSTLGGLWGQTWSASNINNAEFSCWIRARRGDCIEPLGLTTVGIDYIKITVHYTIPGDWPDPSGEYVADLFQPWWSENDNPDCAEYTLSGGWESWSPPRRWQNISNNWMVVEFQGNAYVTAESLDNCDPEQPLCKPAWQKVWEWGPQGPVGSYSNIVGPPNNYAGVVSVAYRSYCTDGGVPNMKTNNYNGHTTFYEVWLNKVVWVNNSFASPSVEHQVSYWYKVASLLSATNFSLTLGSQTPTFSGGVFYDDQDLGLIEDKWNQEGTTAWGFGQNMLSPAFGGPASTPPKPAPAPTEPNTFNIGGFIVIDEKVIKNWLFQYTR